MKINKNKPKIVLKLLFRNQIVFVYIEKAHLSAMVLLLIFWSSLVMALSLCVHLFLTPNAGDRGVQGSEGYNVLYILIQEH